MPQRSDWDGPVKGRYGIPKCGPVLWVLAWAFDSIDRRLRGGGSTR